MMRRTLALGLLLLILVGCADPILKARYQGLRNPAYPGNPNADLVPYQARERDGMDCFWSEAVQTELRAGRDADTALFACLERRGWTP